MIGQRGLPYRPVTNDPLANANAPVSARRDIQDVRSNLRSEPHPTVPGGSQQNWRSLAALAERRTA
jgi:hypothetical protein